ncbi:MarR family winged helix-turn-helix transcriptional regulator [Tessaracoccus oleiagri]|uniref:DNA-binding transcriptional regulator, MarR family n=1 Tax=Tessaracoccus oleiagri TaxID=686624 RepID=A0A1G9HBE3_9ACTN|nr:MarR family transcriptional regulator [Tessaracoccus oleiagri]SDL09793.1 DNA-binding transcriptional regulator, MarR family [Tessaracoccus oleiagri]
MKLNTDAEQRPEDQMDMDPGIGADGPAGIEAGGSERPGVAYWYPGRQDTTAVRILAMLRQYRDADQEIRKHTRSAMLLGDRDLLALRHLLEAQASGRSLRQKDLAHHLGISTASASAMVDRLSVAGYLRRVPHPDDRRSVAIELTDTTQTQVHAALYAYKARQLAAVETLTDEEQAAVVKFLDAMIRAAS